MSKKLNPNAEPFVMRSADYDAAYCAHTATHYRLPAFLWLMNETYLANEAHFPLMRSIAEISMSTYAIGTTAVAAAGFVITNRLASERMLQSRSNSWQHMDNYYSEILHSVSCQNSSRRNTKRPNNIAKPIRFTRDTLLAIRNSQWQLPVDPLKHCPHDLYLFILKKNPDGCDMSTACHVSSNKKRSGNSRSQRKENRKRRDSAKRSSKSLLISQKASPHRLEEFNVQPAKILATQRWQVFKADDEASNAERAIRSILNKLAPEKFDRLLSSVEAITITCAESLDRVAQLIFNKAVEEPNFAPLYARFCSELRPLLPEFEENGRRYDFRTLLLSKCHHLLICDVAEEARMLLMNDKSKSTATPLQLQEMEHVIFEKKKGNIVLIGELFKTRILKSKIMHLCIDMLLDDVDDPIESDIESLCLLLTTVGEQLDNHVPNSSPDAWLSSKSKLRKRSWKHPAGSDAVNLPDTTSVSSGISSESDTSPKRESLASLFTCSLDHNTADDENTMGQYFERLEVLAANRILPSRLRFMVQDLIDLRERNWVLRHAKTVAPRMLDEIRIEGEIDLELACTKISRNSSNTVHCLKSPIRSECLTPRQDARFETSSLRRVTSERFRSSARFRTSAASVIPFAAQRKRCLHSVPRPNLHARNSSCLSDESKLIASLSEPCKKGFSVSQFDAVALNREMDMLAHEYFDSFDCQEVLVSLEEASDAHNASQCTHRTSELSGSEMQACSPVQLLVSKMLLIALERQGVAFLNANTLLDKLIGSTLLDGHSLYCALSEIFAQLPDLAIDAPKAPILFESLVKRLTKVKQLSETAAACLVQHCIQTPTAD